MMGSPNEFTAGETSGFEGEFTGLGLADVFHLQSQNRFSGCITVEWGRRSALVFLRDGEIIHAEEGGQVGEAAFYGVMAWPGGRFSLQPNVTTARVTIQRSCQHLMLEACRLIDERRAGIRAGPPADAQPKPNTAGDLVQRLRRLPCVAYAVVQGKDGARGGDDSYEAEALAGQAIYLSMVGGQLGALFNVGEVHSAAVEGATRHLLLFATRTHYVAALVRGESQLGAAEADVRKVLTARP